MMDRVATRLRCLELARPLFPTAADRDAMLRAAEELFNWATEAAQPAEGSDALGKPTASFVAKSAAVVGEVSTVTEHYTIQAGRWDPDEIKRMNEP